ncbi:17448_t:CDS:2, partial [Dentiscutata erythropus]
LPLCYPAFDLYCLNLSKVKNQPFFWEESSSSSSAVTKHISLEKRETQPSFRVQQVIVQTTSLKNYNNHGVLNKDLLLWTMNLHNKIANTIVVLPNDPSGSNSFPKEYTLLDFCLKPSGSNDCLIHSPLDYWSYDSEKLSNDFSILTTLSQFNSTSSFGIPMPLSSVFGNPIIEKKQGKIISADSIILTYFLEDSTRDQIVNSWDMLWDQVINNIDTKCNIGGNQIKGINITTKGDLKHFYLEVKSTKFTDDFIFLAIQYFMVLLYILLSLNRLNSVKSKIGLTFSMVAQLCASLVIS